MIVSVRGMGGTVVRPWYDRGTTKQRRGTTKQSRGTTVVCHPPKLPPNPSKCIQIYPNVVFCHLIPWLQIETRLLHRTCTNHPVQENCYQKYCLDLHLFVLLPYMPYVIWNLGSIDLTWLLWVALYRAIRLLLWPQAWSPKWGHSRTQSRQPCWRLPRESNGAQSPRILRQTKDFGRWGLHGMSWLTYDATITPN